LATKKKKTRKTAQKKKTGGKKPRPLKKKPKHPKMAKKKVLRGKKVKKLKMKKIKSKKKIKLKKKIKKAPKVKKKEIIIKKKDITAKKRKKEVKRRIIALTPEEIERIAEILSKPVIRHMLVDLGGENAIAIVRNFETGMSDEDISKKLKLKISDVRAALNRLHSEGIVMYDRQKDSETGWYSYSWYLNREKMERWANRQLSRFEDNGDDGREYYICPSCGGSAVMPFETAIEKNFRCEICNHSLEFVDEKVREELGLTLQIRKRL